MSVLTMKVPAKLAAKLEKVSARRKVSKSQIIREALQAALSRAEAGHDLSAYDLMKEGCGVVRSGVGDLSVNKRHFKDYGK
jgi:metal-responsive CopG/Arc/MetJ family transcriptional regulator